MKKVRDMTVRPGMTVSDLISAFQDLGGFTAPLLAKGVDILEEMMRADARRFLAFPACIMATGVRGVLVELIRRRLFDIVITTCGTLDHDIARIWNPYGQGDFEMDDMDLLDRGIHRLGNVLIRREHYGPAIEAKVRPILDALHKSGVRQMSGHEFVWYLGQTLGDESSLVYWCWKHRIPVIIPAWTDGAVGSQIWLFHQDHDFTLDTLADEDLLADVVFTASRTGGFIIGGGVSKHHTIWWNQFRDGLDYAVYVTTAVEHDGSLSGARLREAVSWGKVSRSARYVTIPGEASLIVPVIASALLDRLMEGSHRLMTGIDWNR